MATRNDIKKKLPLLNTGKAAPPLGALGSLPLNLARRRAMKAKMGIKGNQWEDDKE